MFKRIFRRTRTTGELSPGWQLLSAGQADAARLWTLDREKQPDKPSGLYVLKGACLDAVGRHEEALEAYEKELALNPTDQEAKRRRDSLTAALGKEPPIQIPTKARSWHTSLPASTLAAIQRSLHKYTYRGIPMIKNPFDFALYPRLIWDLRPATIIEIGSKAGGSGLWFGDLLDNCGIEGQVYSLDIVKVDNVSHPRVSFWEGDGRNLSKSLTSGFLAKLPRPWMVVEDADHSYETSLAVLRFFHPLLQPGEYIIIEDGIISDLQQDPKANSGPHRALKEFLSAHGNEYEIDANYCDFFGYNLTWCTNGWLRKIAPGSAKT